MKKISIFLFFLIASCTTEKKELEIIWISDPSNLLWNSGQIYCAEQNPQSIVVSHYIISPLKIPENIYNHGYDTVMISSSCRHNAIVFGISDLNIKSDIIAKYQQTYPDILATNVYVKYNRKPFMKYLSINSKKNTKIQLYSVIANPTSFDKPFYTGDFRIENPLYEINHLNHQFKPEKYILIIHTSQKIKDKKYFEDILSNLTLKPLIILANTDKKINVSGINIFPIPDYSKKISIEKRFGIIKLRSKDINNLSSYHKITQLDKLVKNTKEEFDRKITTLSEPISDKKISEITARSMVNFISSDLAVISNSTAVEGLKKGEVRVKNLYNVLKNPNDKLVYIKIKGSNLERLIGEVSNISTIYINTKIDDKRFKKDKIYRMFTTLDFIKENDFILNYVTEFTVLNIQINKPVIWYLKNRKNI